MYKNSMGLQIKGVFDLFFSFSVIVMISPVFLMIAIAIRFEDGGSVFFKQERSC